MSQQGMLKSDPVLASLDIPQTVAFYEEKLGFQRNWCDKGYGIVSRDKISIHFWACDNPLIPQNTSCYVYVDHVDDLYKEYKSAGVIHPNGDIEDKPFGLREFSILDQDGNLIRFGQHLEKKEH